MSASISLVVLADYYLNSDPSLYYLAGSRAMGEWYGTGAESIGYAGSIVPEQLRRAFAGLSPSGDRSLVQAQSGKERQAGWDITFSVPKSVSVLWSRLDAADRQRIEELVLRAVKRALNYLDAEALKTRRGRKGAIVESAEGVYALFPHGTSRALDPQLHVHAVALNMCRRHDGSTGAIRSRDLYWHKMAAGALFRAELAHLLTTELGLSIKPDGWKFSVEGVPYSLCQEFSKRRKEIERLAREGGWSSAKVLSQLAINSRQAKRNVPLEECFARWSETSDKHGFTKKAARALLSVGEAKLTSRVNDIATSVSPNSPHESKLITAFLNSVKSLGAFKSHFPERDLVRETAVRALAFGASASEVLETVRQGVRRFENRVVINRSSYASYSTKQNIAAERELLRRAEEGRSSVKHLVTETDVLRAIAQAERSLSRKLGIPVRLTDDQVSAIRHVTTKPGNLQVVQGYAGTGKTQMLQASSKAWKARGYKVIGTAITGRAALGLEKSSGIATFTIERLLSQLRPQLKAVDIAKLLAWRSKEAINSLYYDGISAGKWLCNPLKEAIKESAGRIAESFAPRKASSHRSRCELTSKTILVVDEAAMVPTTALLALQQECDRAGAKLVLVGDSLQLPAIDAGAPFNSLASRLGHCALTTVVRQRQEWMREATSLLIAEQPQRALECYAANGAFHLARHHRAAMYKLIADYGSLPSNRFGKAIALTATNDEAREINRGVQAKRRASRHLGRLSVQLPNGERAHTGDRVMLTSNDYRLDVRNGLLATVVGISFPRGVAGAASLKLSLDDQRDEGFLLRGLRTVTIDLNKNSNIQLGYAATTHKMQSTTVETSFVLIGDVMLSKERAFTQFTRASHETKVYAAEAMYGDSFEHVARQISNSTAKDLAHDHSLVGQRNCDDRRALLKGVAQALEPNRSQEPEIAAQLAGLKLAANHVGAMWSLAAALGKLSRDQFTSSVAVVTEPVEASRLNAGIQKKRRTAHELGIDSMQLPNGERIFKGDRIVLSPQICDKTVTARLGTVIHLQFGLGNRSDAQITAELDRRPGEVMGKTIRIAATQFSELQLGYAVAANKCGASSVESAFVLLPEGGRSMHSLVSLLSIASKNAFLFGSRSFHGPLLEARGIYENLIPEQQSHRDQVKKRIKRVLQGILTCDESELQLKLEELSHLRKANDEQLQLSWQQAFTL